MNARAEIVDEADNLPVTTQGDLVQLDGSLAIELGRVEIDQQIATARKYPRQISRVAGNIKSMVTLDEDTAEECMYALPRGGKPIKGPSIRFAEVVKACYGNNRSASRVISVDRTEKVVIAEGIFHDLETNTATRSETRRRIVGSNGKIYNDDMIIMTGNAAGSIALRNAILGGVPKALWRGAYTAVQSLIAGDIQTLAETRERAIKAMATFGVTPEQIFTAVGVGGVEDIKLDHVPVLRGMFAALKNGEATVEEMFARATPTLVTNTGLTERLKAKTDAAKEGFTSAQAGDVSAELDRALDGDAIPGAGEQTAAQEAQDQDATQAPAKKPLGQRIAAFKVLVDEAPTTVAAMQLRADHKDLWTDLDAADPDEFGTAAELEAYINERCIEIEDAERKTGGQG